MSHPSLSATGFNVGHIATGNDGNAWIVKVASNGVQRWAKLDSGNTGTELTEASSNNDESEEEHHKRVARNNTTTSSISVVVDQANSKRILSDDNYSALGFFQSAPVEMLCQIASYLTIRDLVSVWSVCKFMNQLHPMPYKFELCIMRRYPKRNINIGPLHYYVNNHPCKYFCSSAKYQELSGFLQHAAEWCNLFSRIPLESRKQVHSIDFDCADDPTHEYPNEIAEKHIPKILCDILDLFPNLTEVIIFDFKFLSAALKHFPLIKKLVIGSGTGCFSCFGGLAKDCQFIESLSTVHLDDGFGVKDFIEICKLKNLRSLSIPTAGGGGIAEDIGDKAFRHIVNLKSLEILHLSGHWEISYKIFKSLNILPCLRELYLDGLDANLCVKSLKENLDSRININFNFDNDTSSLSQESEAVDSLSDDGYISDLDANMQ